MSSTVFSEALIIVVVAVAGGILLTSLSGIAVYLSDTAELQMKLAKDRIESSIQIVYVFYDETNLEIKCWVKNVGLKPLKIGQLEGGEAVLANGETRVFSLSWSNVTLTLYDTDEDNIWGVGETVELILPLGNSLASGDYWITVVLPTGAKDTAYFSV